MAEKTREEVLVNVVVDNKLYITNPTKAIIDYCRDSLVLPNPEYHKKERMGLWLGNTPREIMLFERNGDEWVLPFGCFADVCHMEPQAVYVNRISPKKPVYYNSGISLYPYQEKAVNEAIRKRNGVVVMPCGAGKTQAALEIVARLGGKALWLTHTQDLLTQSMNRAKSVLNWPANKYGTITGGKVNIGAGLTFATVQTMAKIDLADYRDTWDVIITDECHKAVGSPTKCMQFYKVLSSLSARYKYGITATPKRADGLERAMYALLGNKIIEITREEVKNTTCPIRVEKIETCWMPNMDIALAGDGTLNYARLVEDMIHSKERYDIVFGEILSVVMKGLPTLILANRVEYLQKMCEDMVGCGKKAVCLSGAGNSKAAKAERKEALRKLNNGELDCVFASYQLAAEGLDCPNLRYIVFATPEKNDVTVTQSVGRVGRKAEGKEYGTVIDFVDDFAMYKGWSKKRDKIYQKLDCIV